jgi:hypothetical protein
VQVHAAETTGGAAVTGDEHVEAEPNRGQLSLIRTLGRVWPATRSVKETRPAPEHHEVLRRVADTASGRQQVVLPLAKQGLELGLLGLRQVMAIRVTLRERAEEVAAIDLGPADGTPVKERVVAAGFMLLAADQSAGQQQAERVLGEDRVAAGRQTGTVRLQLRLPRSTEGLSS